MKKILALIVFAVILYLGYYCFVFDFKKDDATIFYGGDIITMCDSAQVVEAILVENGKIIATGTKTEIFKFDKKNIRKIDLQGKTLMPGFWDAHGHFDLATGFASMTDITGITHPNAEEVWNIIISTSAKAEKDKWLFFYGFDPIFNIGIRTPTRKILDSIAPNNPVVIITKALHVFYANSAAFKALGITEQTPDPSKTSYYQRDSLGVLTGGIVEHEALEPFKKQILKLYKKDFIPNTKKVIDEYSKYGVTSTINMGTISANKNVLSLYQHLCSEKSTPFFKLLQRFGKLPERQPTQRFFLYFKKEDEQFLPKSSMNGDDFYKVLGIKFWYDGSPYAGTMFLKQPYIKSKFTEEDIHLETHHTGHSILKPEELKKYIEKYQSQGWYIAIHAQGDHANEEVMQVLAQINTETPIAKYRHRIEHGMLLPKEYVNQMKMMNITPSFHINHLLYYGDFLETEILGKERTQLIFPIQSFATTGIPFSLHADMPQFIPNPLQLASSAVNRTTINGKVINAAQKILVWQALKSITIDAAWQAHMETKLGTIEEGKYADLVILDQNPLKINSKDIGNIKVISTYVAGNELKLK